MGEQGGSRKGKEPAGHLQSTVGTRSRLPEPRSGVPPLQSSPEESDELAENQWAGRQRAVNQSEKEVIL